MQKLIVLFISFVLLQLNACERRTSGANNYFQEITNFRAEKNRYLKTDPNSPLPLSIWDAFDSLNYYPVNLSFRIMADFVTIPGRNMITLPLNNDQSRVYIRYGFASFTLDSISYSLLVLKSTEGNTGELFVPFYDHTNGFDTYGGGRYLEPVQISESKILLDFNKANNPFCAYSPEYICPLPPRENLLQIPVMAGEKNFEKY